MCKQVLWFVVCGGLMVMPGWVLAQDYNIEIPSTPSAPEIDGEIDAAYSLSGINYFATIDATTVTPEDCSGNWRALWDATYIYIIVDVNDDILFADSGTWQDDAAEFYFDGGNSKGPGTPLSEDDRQYTFLYNQEPLIAGTNTNTAGVVYATLKTETGWRMEAKLPWDSLQDAEPLLGDLIGVDCFVNDDDDGGTTREHQLGTFAASGNAWQIPADWGTAILVEGDLSKASGPQPESDSTGVLPEVMLRWKAGLYAASHNVYFGTSADDVDNADPANPLDVLAAEGLDESALDLGMLDFGTTYYWRVDEVNSPPDNTVYKGEVWNFTVEPVSFPLATERIQATSSSMTDPKNDPSKTIDGSGLDALDQHTNNTDSMWLSAATDAGPVWIQYALDRVYQLDKLHVWNHNSQTETILGFGIQEALIEHSLDGENWVEFGTVTLAQAPGKADYAGEDLTLGGIKAQYLKITSLSNYSLIGIQQSGLSEVRIYNIPNRARELEPVSGAVDLDPGVVLSWIPGREAVQHEVLIGSSPDSLAVEATVDEASYTSSFDLGSTVYWQINEVNDLADPAVWEGDIWSLTTAEYISVDDMESYKSKDGYWVWETWIDGFDDDNNGALLGHDGDNMEKDIVYDGLQSLPYYYGQGGASDSEAVRDIEQDWGQHGIVSLSLMFQGAASNTPAQMYIKVNDTRIADYPNSADLLLPEWQTWTIDLPAAALGNVKNLAIGFEGGSGMVIIDAIRLYP